MKRKISEKELDRLLAQPALIADHGFTKQLSKKLPIAESRRILVFVSVAVSWVLLALIVGSPEQLLSQLTAPNSVLDSFLSSILQLVPLRELLAIDLELENSFSAAVFAILIALLLSRQLGEE